MAKKTSKDLITVCRTILDAVWNEVSARAAQGAVPDVLDDPSLLDAIKNAIRSKIKSYRYVLPTQLVAKLADPSLDCRCLQAKEEVTGAFDARSIADGVLVAFDAANHHVLGGSPEPYVNNPLRVPAVSPTYAKAQKNKQGWSELCRVLAACQKQDDSEFTKALFTQTLIEIHRRLAEVRVAYPVPLRVSLARTLRLVDEFLAEQSGGDRVQAVACALFLLIGRRFGLYAKVERAVINAADAATGLAADLECTTEEGAPVLAVEVKDKELTVSQLETKLKTARAKKIAEVLFVAQKGVEPGQEAAMVSRIEEEFTRGQNVYVFDLNSLARSVLALMGGKACPAFLELIGEQLEQFRSDIRHRKAWSELLSRQ
jgi:hypothetical protein